MRKLLAVFLLMAAVLPIQAGFGFNSGSQDQKETYRRLRAIGYSVPPIAGKWFFVNPNDSNDNASGISPEEAVSNICSAYVKCTSGAGDGIIVLSHGTALSQTNNRLVHGIAWSKHGITVVGACSPGRYGKRSRIGSGAGLGGDTLMHLITVTGNNNAFFNLLFINEGDSTTASGCVSVTGVQNHFENCEFSNVGAAATADTLVHSLEINTGNCNTFVRCCVGNDTKDRSSAALTAELWIVGACGKNVFENCYFSMLTNDDDHGLVKIIGTTSLGGSLIFDNCKFWNWYANADLQTLTTVFIGADPNTGIVVMHNCSIAGWADVAPDAFNCVVTNLPAANAAGGISVVGE